MASPSWARELTLTAVIPFYFKHKHIPSSNQIKPHLKSCDLTKGLMQTDSLFTLPL